MEFIFREFGFTQILSESCLSVKCSGDILVIVAVDDDKVITAHKYDTMFQSILIEVDRSFQVQGVRITYKSIAFRDCTHSC